MSVRRKRKKSSRRRSPVKHRRIGMPRHAKKRHAKKSSKRRSRHIPLEVLRHRFHRLEQIIGQRSG